ncbi:MAG: exodeoxyribonuclease III [Candidatus Nanopelagicales bacterium]|nr:exodeoxyribonuclease III [Candidatus Nanopelagicales bacterium]
MKVISVNVNGVRAAARRGGLESLAAGDPDVLCLQEVRSSRDQLTETLADSGLEHLHLAHAPCSQPGRCGVAILTKEAPREVRVAPGSISGSGGGPVFAECGRWVEVDIGWAGRRLTVASVYVPSGEAGTAKQEAKYRFLDLMDRRLAELRRIAADELAEVVVVGDFNVAHQRVDIKNWRGNRDRAGFLPAEREHVGRWLSAGWVDVGRAHAGPETPGPYTWWTWRGRAFENDVGWRIDYLLATPGIAGRLVDYRVGRAGSYSDRWSDHAPVLARFRR